MELQTMMQAGIGSYITGLTHMASSLSPGRNPSFVEADCFDLKDCKKDFAKWYRISEKLLELTPMERSLEELLAEWINDRGEVLEALLHHMRCCLGEPVALHEPVHFRKLADKLSRSEGGISAFYFVEDICFVEYKKYMLCLMLGNNE